jgi:aspartate racemase
MSESNIQCLVPGILAMAVNTDVAYYRLINDAAQRQFGARPNALRMVLHKIDFAAFVDAIRDGALARAQALIAQGLEQLRSGGADFAVVTANAAGVMAERISSELGLPLMRITDPVCRTLAEAGAKKAGLLAVRETYRSRIYQLAAHAMGIEVIEPPDEVVSALEALIFDDLIHGRFTESGVQVVLNAISGLANMRADAIIFGCTDLTHLIPMIRDRAALPLFDSTHLHAVAAAEVAIYGWESWRRAHHTPDVPSATRLK